MMGYCITFGIAAERFDLGLTFFFNLQLSKSVSPEMLH